VKGESVFLLATNFRDFEEMQLTVTTRHSTPVIGYWFY